MKLFLALAAAMIPLLFTAGPASDAQPEGLKAVYNLSGVLQSLENKELVVTFSEDMLPLGGTRDGASLVRITPAVKGEFFWRGNRTLAFKPVPRFRYSTTYTAVIPAGTRSLAGKTLAREIRWQWSTPQAYPVEVRSSGQEYFSDLAPEQKLRFKVWVKDSLVVRFGQPVVAARAVDFIVLKEEKSGARVQLRLVQEGDDAIAVVPAAALQRGALYHFVVGKGFCGSEGSTGIGKDFVFSFDTVPTFQYAGGRPLVLYPDAPYCWLPFSNSLADFSPEQVRVFRIAGKKTTPLRAEKEPRYYENEALFLHIKDELASGDSLRIVVDRSLANVYQERLSQDLELDARVCSSRSPRLDFSLQDRKLTLAAKSVKRAAIRLFKFKPEFSALLASHDFGLLQQPGFAGKFVESELLQQLAELPENWNNPALRDKELGSPLGFFGFLVQRYEPYNACRDIALMRLPAFDPPQLEVFHRRQMDMVVKYAPGQTLFWLYDNRSGAGLAHKPFFLLTEGGEPRPVGESAADGLLLSDREMRPTDLVLARDPGAGDMALARIGQPLPANREIRISVFSDRDFYKPGETVHIGGVVKEYVSGKVSSPRTAAAAVEIIGPDWQRLKSDSVALDPWGGFRYDFQSDAAGKKGSYQVRVTVQDLHSWQGQRSVVIDYYQPNTFQMTVAGVSERYRFQDVFGPTLSGAYLAGNPMAGDEYSYTLGAAIPGDPRVFKSDGLARYGFGLDRDLVQGDPPVTATGKLDPNGARTLAVPMKTFKATNHLAELAFTATGRSAEGKEFTTRARSLFFPGDLLAGIRIGYYQNLREPVRAELALVDSQGQPASAQVRVTLYREYYENNQRRLKAIQGPADLFVARTATHAFRVAQAGRYVLRCDAVDGSGRVISTSDGFFAWDSAYSDRDDDLRIEAEQKALRSGETLKCFIRSPKPGQALLTIERGRVLDSRIIALQNMTALEIPVKRDYFPAFRVSVIAVYADNESREATADFTVQDKNKTLGIELEGPTEIKPASKTRFSIRVSDSRKQGARAKLFIYAVDEGNLSLQGYRTPDLLHGVYYSDPLGREVLRTLYSKHFTHWMFARPMLDIALPQPAIFGAVLGPDAAPIAGATVTLEDANHRKLKTAATSRQGYYSFSGMPGGHYAVKAEASGFRPFLRSDVYFNGGSHADCDMALIPIAGGDYWDGGEPSLNAAGGVMAAAPPMAAEMKSMARRQDKGEAEDGVAGGKDVATDGIRVRRDFKEVLFFKTLETDEAGNAVVDFESSDQLSTYRIMAVAYSEDCFGRAEKELVVSKDLLISEAMPEFARQGDAFLAGAQLSNRTGLTLPFTLLAKPAGITISGAAKVEGVLDPRGNGLFRFPFTADRVGEAMIGFFALSAADKDGLEKKLAVSDRLVSETLLDFASGREVRKSIAPQDDGEEQTISIKVAPSLLRPAVNIAKKLVFYPYECLEQRTSKVMPFLALSPQLAERLDLGLDQAQVRDAVTGYLKIVPEFMGNNGALSYYRGGQYTSDYLTAYVLWALHLAKERDYTVDPQLVQKLAGYLQRASLDKTCESFYQFVLSTHREADAKKLKQLAAERAALPLPARVFLYRALHNQGGEAALLKTMLAEFNNSLQVEADFAYFDVGEFVYNRDFPFYSSRFATALLLQAVLEVEHGHVLAERIINWLLEGEPHCWDTTQTNFWVLCAMDEYLQQVEKTTALRAAVSLLGEKTGKDFVNSRDSLQVQRKLEGRREPIAVLVQADQPVYVTSELTWKLGRAGKKSRGIDIERFVYDVNGRTVETFQRGQVYQVELLLRADKEVPYGVIDEPLAAGFELLREDIASTRSLKEFNTANAGRYRSIWARRENAADRLVFYTYSMKGDLRIVYFIKALYGGRFTWMPAIAQGMYHPQYFGRTAIQTIEVRE